MGDPRAEPDGNPEVGRREDAWSNRDFDTTSHDDFSDEDAGSDADYD